MRKWALVLLLAALAVPALAGIRRNERKVENFSIDDVDMEKGWSITEPCIRKEKVGYLSYDATGKSKDVTFEEKDGPHARWEFVNRHKYERTVVSRPDPKPDLVERGDAVKVRATEGPFKGWYLARKNGAFVLVKDVEEASTLQMAKDRADVFHK